MDISWVLPFLVGVALPGMAKILDAVMERRKAAAAGQREDRKTVWERLDILEAKYDALRDKYDRTIDEKQAAEEERDHLKRLYIRVVNTVQYLVLDNDLMCRRLGIKPTHSYAELSGELLDGGGNPNG